MTENKTRPTDAQKGPTKGAGVDPKRIINKTKRLKRAYRLYCIRTTESKRLSMKAWARGSDVDSEYAGEWLMHKSKAFTKDAMVERRKRAFNLKVLAKSKDKTKDKSKE